MTCFAKRRVIFMAFPSGMVFHSLFRAHHNAVQTGLFQNGLGDIGSPRLLMALRDQCSAGRTPSQRELADLLHVSAATIATSLKSLERNGYVARRTDPSDSRRNQITITEKGKAALDASHNVFETVDEFMFSGFSDAEIEQLNGFHLRMLHNLYEIGGDQDAPCPPPPPLPRKDDKLL